MPHYLHVYRTPSGQWSEKVLEEVAGIAGCEHPVEVLESALEQFEGIEDLPKGSREANRSFDFATYDKRGETYADQWFLGAEPMNSTNTNAITLPLPGPFARFCERAHVAPEALLMAFMADLAELSRPTAGECLHARRWFDSVTEPIDAEVTA
ncbi:MULTISPECIES: hypothetical protein [Xanthomonas]|uniref:Uncharacterized protein n=2 Tax=Xanthomonas citri TaxID=346 RepID=A0A0U5FA54_XANCI|nr:MULTISPECIES: hypothetical protein [Xanthomonas]CEE28341.1 hypothetical protein XAC908_1500005 [Xanthomonas citri pv. citri]CEE28446.1 hypothetical protein XAC902_1770008 [Xanthomonas citri pv. citri]CEG15122.1 hypothetical protein XAC3562_1740009 [Xanthomonas citri pv. citri]CEH52181.1 hypothetical protein XACLD7_15280009 [Xanthomonas citri pv. citri]CEH85184.1 hypothetical protein XACLH37_3450007 [Xanthomonas citri pv. citri]